MANMEEQARDVSKMFRETADELDKHFDNVKMARAIGTGAHLLGKLATLGELHRESMDDGANFVATLGAVATFVGGVAAGGAEIVGDIIEKKKYTQMEQLWDAFRKELGDMLDPTLSQEEIERKIEKKCHDGFESANLVKEVMSLSKQRFTASPCKAMIRKVLSLEQLSRDTFQCNVCDLIKVSMEIAIETKSPVGRILRNLADKLDNLFKK